jgi:hypothetical protein
MAIRWDLYDQKNASLNSEVNRMMANILESLNQFPVIKTFLKFDIELEYFPE